MHRSDSPVDQAYRLAIHVTSQLKQLSLRDHAGKPPTLPQMEHINVLHEQLTLAIERLLLAADSRRENELRALFRRDG